MPITITVSFTALFSFLTVCSAALYSSFLICRDAITGIRIRSEINHLGFYYINYFLRLDYCGFGPFSSKLLLSLSV